MASEVKKINLNTPAIIAGWGLTIIILVWQLAIKDSEYSLKTDHLQVAMGNLDSRLDTAEEFRLDISSDLAEIKTDLIWIRKQLEENASGIRKINEQDR